MIKSILEIRNKNVLQIFHTPADYRNVQNPMGNQTIYSRK